MRVNDEHTTARKAATLDLRIIISIHPACVDGSVGRCTAASELLLLVLRKSAQCASRNSTVDEQRLPGHVAACFRSQEDDGTIEIGGLPWALKGNSLREVLHPTLILIEHAALLSLEPARCKAINRNSVLAPVCGEAHSHLATASTARTVRCKTRIACNASYGPDVDDAAVAFCGHAASNGLGHEEAAAQIRVKHRVPVIPRDFKRELAPGAARIVDENVNLTEGSVGFLSKSLNALLVRNIEFERNDATAERLDFRFERSERIEIPAGDDEVGAGLGQRSCEVLAQPTAGAGNNGNLATEIKKCVVH